jgi:hypothetical protein
LTWAELEAALGARLDDVRRRLGSPPLAVRCVSTLHASGSPRAAYRVGLADGRAFKVRRLAEPGRARDLVAGLADLAEPRLAAALLEHDGVLVEEWVEGEPLAADAGRERLAEAGDLLGSLHARRTWLGAPLGVPASTEAERRTLEGQLADLVRAGALGGPAARRLRSAAAASDPGRAATGLVHRDFCAENLVVDRAGRLRVVDNEWLGVGPLDLDLAVVENRWPTDAAGRAAFLAGYARHRDPAAAGEASAFWRIRAATRSAWWRAVELARPAEAALARLEALAGGAGAGRPARAAPTETAAGGRRRWPAWYHEDNRFPTRRRMDQVHRPIVALALRELAGRGGDVLDLGCGNGALLRRLARGDARAVPFGVDVEAGSVAHAKELLPRFAANFVRADLFGDAARRALDRRFRLVLLAPRRLLEAGPERSAALLAWLRPRCERLLVYAYGTARTEFGDFHGLARAVGVELERGTRRRASAGLVARF